MGSCNAFVAPHIASNWHFDRKIGIHIAIFTYIKNISENIYIYRLDGQKITSYAITTAWNILIDVLNTHIMLDLIHRSMATKWKQQGKKSSSNRCDAATVFVSVYAWACSFGQIFSTIIVFLHFLSCATIDLIFLHLFRIFFFLGIFSAFAWFGAFDAFCTF